MGEKKNSTKPLKKKISPFVIVINSDLIISFLLSIIILVIPHLSQNKSVHATNFGITSLFYMIIELPYILIGSVMALFGESASLITFFIFGSLFGKIFSLIFLTLAGYYFAKLIKKTLNRDYLLLNNLPLLILLIFGIYVFIYVPSDNITIVENCLENSFPSICFFDIVYTSPRPSMEEIVELCSKLNDEKYVSLIDNEVNLSRPISYSDYCILKIARMGREYSRLDACKAFGEIKGNNKKDLCLQHVIEYEFFIQVYRSLDDYWETVQPLCDAFGKSLAGCNQELVKQKIGYYNSSVLG